MHREAQTSPGAGRGLGDPPLASAIVRHIVLGERQRSGPLAVFPLVTRLEGDGRRTAPARRLGDGPYYITLERALAEGRAQVTEVHEAGSVQELRVVNRGDARILILDGQELHGAKQNRVLSTTVLVEKHAELVVPVSCVEQGRWAFVSREFAAAEQLADRRVRHLMRRSTHMAMAGGASPRADQAGVWHEVAHVHRMQGTSSVTGALGDAFLQKKRDLDRVVAAFPLIDGQQGLLVLHGTRVVGLDYVSRPEQYAELHDRLLRSYALEALVRDGEPGDRPLADAFLRRVEGLVGRRFKSPGLGWDVRFEGDGVLGSALVYRGRAVHAAFFDSGGVLDDADVGGPGRSSGPRWRIADAGQRAAQRRRY